MEENNKKLIIFGTVLIVLILGVFVYFNFQIAKLEKTVSQLKEGIISEGETVTPSIFSGEEVISSEEASLEVEEPSMPEWTSEKTP